jgi:hypothetical protein
MKRQKKWLLKALLNGSARSPVVVEHYGDILYKLGDVENAVLQWKKSKDLGGDSELLYQKIEEEILYE